MSSQLRGVGERVTSYIRKRGDAGAALVGSELDGRGRTEQRERDEAAGGHRRAQHRDAHDGDGHRGGVARDHDHPRARARNELQLLARADEQKRGAPRGDAAQHVQRLERDDAGPSAAERADDGEEQSDEQADLRAD